MNERPYLSNSMAVRNTALDPGRKTTFPVTRDPVESDIESKKRKIFELARRIESNPARIARWFLEDEILALGRRTAYEVLNSGGYLELCNFLNSIVQTELVCRDGVMTNANIRLNAAHPPLDLACDLTLNTYGAIMAKTKNVYALIVQDVEEIQCLRETVVVQAFATFEREHTKLANLVQSATRDRKCAAFWMCRPLRGLGGRTAYQALAEGDEDSLWDQLSPTGYAD